MLYIRTHNDTPLSFRFVVQPDGSMAAMATSESSAYGVAFLGETLQNIIEVLKGKTVISAHTEFPQIHRRE